ncbi:MAG: HD domain-containing protein, partial [Oscillospiraceae bacterium]|nr:HD domain-containing protein [Oscillospiraceae bacterium]
MDQEIIERAKEYIREIFKNNADGHDFNHSIRVYENARNIAAGYPACDLLVVSLAALLHDVDDHKLFSTENNQNARAFLQDQSLGQNKIERICTVINAVSFSKNR